jgi:hypothetical protein
VELNTPREATSCVTLDSLRMSYYGILHRVAIVKYRSFGRFLQEPHGVTSQKTAFFIGKEAKTSSLTLDSSPAFYGTRRFITTCPYPEPYQSNPPSHHISTRSSLMSSTHLRLSLPSGLFPSGYLTNNLYAVLFLPFVPHVLPISSSSTL